MGDIPMFRGFFSDSKSSHKLSDKRVSVHGWLRNMRHVSVFVRLDGMASTFGSCLCILANNTFVCRGFAEITRRTKYIRQTVFPFAFFGLARLVFLGALLSSSAYRRLFPLDYFYSSRQIGILRYRTAGFSGRVRLGFRTLRRGSFPCHIMPNINPKHNTLNGCGNTL